MEEKKTKKVAIFIDSENINYKNCTQIIENMSQKGEIIIKQIVADWTNITSSRVTSKKVKSHYYVREEQLDGWRKEAAKYSMTPVQQFVYVAKKNTIDISVVISAMKALYEKPFIDIFCIVASDSDYTRLAQELRAHNKEVIGMGMRSTAVPEFVNAFSEFIYLGESVDDETADEVMPEKEEKTIAPVAEKKVETKPAQKTARKKAAPKPKPEEPAVQESPSHARIVLLTNDKGQDFPMPEEQLDKLREITLELLESEGTAYYNRIAADMKKHYSDFIASNYGFKSFSKMMQQLLQFMPEFEEKLVPAPKQPNSTIAMLVRKAEKTDGIK